MPPRDATDWRCRQFVRLRTVFRSYCGTDGPRFPRTQIEDGRTAAQITSPGGRLIFHVFGALAEFERDLITERTTAGLAAARARGRQGGRPPKLTSKQVRTAKRLYDDSELTVAEIGQVFGVSRATIYRCIGATAR